MTTKTTTRLQLPIQRVAAWYDRRALPPALTVALSVLALAAILATLQHWARPPASPAFVPVIERAPVILIATTTAQPARVITVERVIVATPTAAPTAAPAPAQADIAYAAELAPTASPVATQAPIQAEVATAVAAQPGATVVVVSDHLQDSDDPVVRESYRVFPPK